MRFHVPALPGQPTIAANSHCAYTQKIRKFAEMMTARGHEVFVYTGADRDCDQPADRYVEAYSTPQPVPFEQEAWRIANVRAAAAIAEREEPGDFLCLIAGRCQEKLTQLLPDLRAVEFGIGYGGSFAEFRVFESYAWMHATYAAQDGPNIHDANGRFYDAVIPNYFDSTEFPAGDGEGQYLLYVGRMAARKGVELAAQVAERAGISLLLAGAEGDAKPGYGEWIGPVGPEDRARLMGGARALIAPTYYLEPFGGVVVEAQMCGTPVITTDWGAFPETVDQGVSGYRCRSMAEFLDAVQFVGEMDRGVIRRRAIGRWATGPVSAEYEEYFLRLRTLQGEGFYDEGWTKGLGDPA